MLDKLIEVSLPLCYEKYSNYIIQKILMVGNIDNKSKLLNNIVFPNFFKLAKISLGAMFVRRHLEMHYRINSKIFGFNV